MKDKILRFENWTDFQKLSWLPVLLISLSLGGFTAILWANHVDVYSLIQHQAQLKQVHISDSDINNSIPNITRLLPFVTLISILSNFISKLAIQCIMFWLIVIIAENRRIPFFCLLKSFSTSKIFVAIKYATIIILILSTEPSGKTIQELYPLSLGRMLLKFNFNSINIKFFTIDVPMILDLVFGSYLAFKIVRLNLITKITFLACYASFTLIDLIH